MVQFRPYDLIRKRLATEVVYLVNSFEDIAIKVSPDANTLSAKFKGGKKNTIYRSSQVVVEALNEAKEITAEEFENY